MNTFATALMLGLLAGGAADMSQTPAPKAVVEQEPAKAIRQPTVTQLTVQVVVTKLQGDKKVSNVPYTLSVVANSGKRASLRQGARLPVATQASGSPVVSYSYTDIGVGIDCEARSAGDGRFSLDLTVDDSSVLTDPPAGSKTGDQPVFRSFRASQTLLLREGQSAQFTAATDKLSGEVTKVEVTLAGGK